jgi:hypothetical protein
MMRNRAGRLHFYWLTSSGAAFEFYTKGASRRSYWRNALTLGEVRRAAALDEAPRGADTMKASEIITLAEREADRLEHENDHAAAVIMRELVWHLRSSTSSLMVAVGAGGPGCGGGGGYVGDRTRKIV